MFIIIYILIFGCLSLYLYYRFNKNVNNVNTPPFVKNSLPFFGHGISFSKDIIGFIRNCYKEYGKIFTIKIFRKRMTVICDRELIKEFFSYKEDESSLYKVLDSLYFSDAFSDDPKKLDRIIKLVKKTITIRYAEFIPKIFEEANILINNLKNTNSNKTDLISETIRFVSRTSAKCFICYDMPSEFYNALMDFTKLLNRIVVLTYFLPKSVLRLVFNPMLRKYRYKMTNALNKEIEEYRKNPDKRDSLVFRSAVDFVDDEMMDKLSNQDIGDIIVCLLYVSSENTALALAATLIDIGSNIEYWNKVKDETRDLIKNKDYRELFANELLDNCVMESCRLNTHVFALNRKPITKDFIGEYFVGGDTTDCIALCEPMLMKFEASHDFFKNPEEYNPNRFNIEGKTPDFIYTFGNGIHLCPGKNFAILEIKAATALIVNNFEFFDIKELTKSDYFSPSAFAERHVNISFKPIKKYQKIGNSYLFKEYLTEKQQIELYNYTISLNKNVIELNKTTATPFVYYNLVYTGKSNCDEPKEWLNLAKEISGELPITLKNFNSVYTQLFSETSTMKDHVDEHVTWGVSISLGASCDLHFGATTITLNSGDILISDFSKILHGVAKVYDNKPYWYDNKYGYRLSVQIRNVNSFLGYSENEFKNMIK